MLNGELLLGRKGDCDSFLVKNRKKGAEYEREGGGIRLNVEEK